VELKRENLERLEGEDKAVVFTFPLRDIKLANSLSVKRNLTGGGEIRRSTIIEGGKKKNGTNLMLEVEARRGGGIWEESGETQDKKQIRNCQKDLCRRIIKKAETELRPSPTPARGGSRRTMGICTGRWSSGNLNSPDTRKELGVKRTAHRLVKLSAGVARGE